MPVWCQVRLGLGIIMIKCLELSEKILKLQTKYGLCAVKCKAEIEVVG